MDSSDSRFAPPVAHVEDVALESADVPALRGMRLLAIVIDTVLIGGSFWILIQVPAIRTLVYGDRSPANPGMWVPMNALFGYLLLVLIQGWPLARRGQTIGKMVCRLRIVRADGSKPEAWRLLGLRYGVGYLLGVNTVLSMIYGLVDSLLIFRTSRKCLHDTIAGTRVIKF